MEWTEKKMDKKYWCFVSNHFFSIGCLIISLSSVHEVKKNPPQNLIVVSFSFPETCPQAD